MRIAITRIRWLTVLCLLYIFATVAACGSSVSTTGGAMSPGASTSSTATSRSSTAQLPRPCTFLTHTIAAQISGDTTITNQGTDVTEPASGYVACIFADTSNEANSVEVQIKRVSGGVNRSTLRGAATFFSLGEPVQPFQPFSVVGIGNNALGETTPGVAFVVFSDGDALVYVRAGSTSASAASLRAGVENLAMQVATAL